MFKTLSILSLALMLFSHTRAFSDDSEKQNNNPEEVSCILQILTEQPDSIIDCEEDKLYLDYSKIVPTENGLTVTSRNSVVVLPLLYSNPRGCYIKFKPNDETYRSWFKCTNPKCKRLFIDQVIFGNSSICPVCGAVAYRK